MGEMVNRADVDLISEKIESLIEESRKRIVTQVNSVMVRTYYEIGRIIVENEQAGESRAAYGRGLLRELSRKLTARYGKGFSVDNLENMRRFYLTYSKRIFETASRKSDIKKPETSSRISQGELKTTTRDFALSWSHYLFLIRIDNSNERDFYEKEAIQGCWSLRELKRQFNSALYERLTSRMVKGAIADLSRQGMIVEKPEDIVKDPYVLEFLGLPEQQSYSESTLESRIIDHLQDFLMEMGKGFTFVGRQVRFTFNKEHFRVDLVLYNRLLRCFVLVDLKIGKLKHQDLGQMQMYVNYYDRYEKTQEENPTIGILLCREKSDQMVKLTLPKDSNIFVSTYQLYIPDKELLQYHTLYSATSNNPNEQDFYEKEAIQGYWSLRELKRQFNSVLYERLASRMVKGAIADLSRQGMIVEKPEDIVKDPYVLEFLGLPEQQSYSESTLESRIIDHLQDFLMEMGKGFTFVGRQIRFTFNKEHFRVDLIFYNRLLRCFILVDLKIGKRKHQDLGRMQMYVNYYDRYKKTKEENPTIGILLCNEKSDQMVELTLPEDCNIYASKYQLYLPDKKLLQEKLIQWLEEEENANE